MSSTRTSYSEGTGFSLEQNSAIYLVHFLFSSIIPVLLQDNKQNKDMTTSVQILLKYCSPTTLPDENINFSNWKSR